MIETFLLDRYWVFKETNGQRVPEWLTVERVPTNVHLDLLHHKVYADLCASVFRLTTH